MRTLSVALFAILLLPALVAADVEITHLPLTIGRKCEVDTGR